MTLPSLKTYAFDEGCTKCIQRCIDSLLQTVKLIKWKKINMLKFTANYKYISNLQKYVKV